MEAFQFSPFLFCRIIASFQRNLLFSSFTPFQARRSLICMNKRFGLVVRRAALIGLALSLLFPGIPVSAQTAQPGAKRALTHQDYDAWRSIFGQQISRDGKWIAYALIPQDGDGEVIVRNVATGNEWRSGRGWRPPLPPPDLTDPTAAQNFQAQMTRLTRPAFTADSRFIAFTIEPNKADVLKARREKKKPEEMPKNALGLMDLSSGKVTRIDRLKNFQVPEEGTGFIAYQLEAKPAESAPEKKADASTSAPAASATANAAASAEKSPAPAERKPAAKKREYGTDLVLRNLSSNTERTFADVLEYSFSKDAKNLIYTVSAKDESRNGIFNITPATDAAPAVLLAGKGRYLKLTWDEDQTQMAFLSDRDDADAAQPKLKIYHWKRGAMQASEIVSINTPDFRRSMVVSERGAMNFSQDGARLFLSTAPPPEPEKEADANSTEEKAVVDLWHWKDDYIQPMQKVRAELERNRSYRAVWHVNERKFVQLADETLPTVNASANGLWAVGLDDRAYRTMIGWKSGNVSDVYLVNTRDGSRRLLKRRNDSNVSWSPNEKFALWHDGRDWWSISIPEGRETNLTKNLDTKFYDELHDSPTKAPSYGLAGWLKGDSHVLLYDRYDIWQIAPDGSSAKNLTDATGRREKTELRYVRLDMQEKWIDPAKPLMLRADNETTRETGFWRDFISGGQPEKLLMAAKNFSVPVKARDADALLLTASRFEEFPDLRVTDSTFRNLKKVSDVGAQKDKFLWGRSELIHFRNTDGVALDGVLIKPENFDPQQKYPMLVYIYERLSEGLHRFTDPRPGHSINPSFYASNGYLVLLPDITYTTGYPGQSALKCVLPAVQAVVDQGFVNENAIGIQGHSWGGYQIAYMVTQTNRFKAAAPGALVANMTSAYSGIRWGTGLPRQFQYEQTQSRIGGNLWEYPMRFLENSPVFQADRIQTPILMLHNDADDAVPWYQGIEFYLALRRLDKEVYFFNYNGEPHGLRKRANQKDYTMRLQQFFDHYLKGASKPEWMEKGIPFLQRDKEKEKYKTASDGR
jgi:dipeptidyl aminopeptidase/acylaminoacyl peptidase